jgi:hypothetical protein
MGRITVGKKLVRPPSSQHVSWVGMMVHASNLNYVGGVGKRIAVEASVGKKG